jgi:hypothetical protein
VKAKPEMPKQTSFRDVRSMIASIIAREHQPTVLTSCGLHQYKFRDCIRATLSRHHNKTLELDKKKPRRSNRLTCAARGRSLAKQRKKSRAARLVQITLDVRLERFQRFEMSSQPQPRPCKGTDRWNLSTGVVPLQHHVNSQLLPRDVSLQGPLFGFVLIKLPRRLDSKV